jgi:hypothetical protein
LQVSANIGTSNNDRRKGQEFAAEFLGCRIILDAKDISNEKLSDEQLIYWETNLANELVRGKRILRSLAPYIEEPDR